MHNSELSYKFFENQYEQFLLGKTTLLNEYFFNLSVSNVIFKVYAKTLQPLAKLLILYIQVLTLDYFLN
jgi:hypothetical protein